MTIAISMLTDFFLGGGMCVLSLQLIAILIINTKDRPLEVFHLANSYTLEDIL